MKTYHDGTTPGMKANMTIHVSELAHRYGNPDSTKLYEKEDLLRRFMHQWGMEYIR